MNRVEVTRCIVGLCGMQVCAVPDATDEEILDICKKENPAGTSLNWVRVAREADEDENIRPVPCEKYPGRTHFIVIC